MTPFQRLLFQVYCTLFIVLMSAWHITMYAMYRREYLDTYQEGVSMVRFVDAASGEELIEIQGRRGSLNNDVIPEKAHDLYTTSAYSGFIGMIQSPRLVGGCDEIIVTSVLMLGCSEFVFVATVLLAGCSSGLQECPFLFVSLLTINLVAWYLCFNVKIWLSSSDKCGQLTEQGRLYCVISYIHFIAFVAFHDANRSAAPPIASEEADPDRDSTISHPISDDSSLTSLNSVTQNTPQFIDPSNSVADSRSL
eukprot:TRINITY_DN11175_c0_g1_i1.p1 TRINITY_DN11175_c0_g1~~TRINITY_DN11175_c0_g1_i1.p1  ORF type:complete len:251 (+),score=23.48 TRINITY_DN11175_c0_g1_i1:161-913(+)